MYHPIKHIKLEKGMSVNDLVKAMHASGVMQAGKIADATDVLEKMIKDKDCRVFFGQSGALVPGGMRQIMIDMLKNKWVDVFCTTGATLTHDIAEALGHRHYQGDEKADDVELEKQGIDRMYDSYMKDDVYKSIENFIMGLRDKFSKKKFSIQEFLWELGKNLENESILKVCYENKIPIFCPALADCGLGIIIWTNLIQENHVEVGAFDDLKEMMNLAWDCKKAGVFYLGGSVPKNYIQQAMQFCGKENGASYGVQVTTDRPEYGASSGASLREGISWGKMKYDGEYVDVICDSTIALPIIVGALKDRI